MNVERMRLAILSGTITATALVAMSWLDGRASRAAVERRAIARDSAALVVQRETRDAVLRMNEFWDNLVAEQRAINARRDSAARARER